MRCFIVLVALFFVVDSRYFHEQDKVYKFIHNYEDRTSNQIPHRQSQNNEPKNHQNLRRQINERLSNIEKKLENMLWYMQRPQSPPQPQINYVPYIIPHPLPLPILIPYYENIKPKLNRTEDSGKDLGVTDSSSDTVNKNKYGFVFMPYPTERNPIDNLGQDLNIAVSIGKGVNNDKDSSVSKVKETDINSPNGDHFIQNTYVTEKTLPEINDSHKYLRVNDSKTEKTPAEIDLDKDVGVTNNSGDSIYNDKESSTPKIYETNVSSAKEIYETEITLSEIHKGLGRSNKSSDGVHSDKDGVRPVTDRIEISLPKGNDSDTISNVANATEDFVEDNRDGYSAIPFVVSHEPTPKPASIEHGSKQVGEKTPPPASAFLKPGKCHAAIFSCCGLKLKSDIQDCFIKYNCARTFATGLSCTTKIQDMVFEIYKKMYGVNEN